MSKVSKRRFCPGQTREISPAECGEKRNSAFVCPGDCVFNPFAVSNYEKLLETEGALDKKILEWAVSKDEDNSRARREFEKSFSLESPTKTNAYFLWNLHGRRDEKGLSCVERWLRTGTPELNNDFRALLAAKARMRLTLFEVQRVIDSQRLEIVDLFAPEAGAFVLLDRSAASVGLRFSSGLAWGYPLPHFFRLSGTATILPDITGFGPLEVVTEIVRHLGGPVDLHEMPSWLAENFEKFEDALNATSEARRQKTWSISDIKQGRAVYELVRPFPECRALLETAPNVSPDTLSKTEQEEGFSEARVWVDSSSEKLLGLGDQALGRILIGQIYWRIEAIGEKRLRRFQNEFEQTLEGKIKLHGERLDNIAAGFYGTERSYDPKLVPEKLLETTLGISVTSSRISPLIASQLRGQQGIWRAADESFLDAQVPALENRTPREAAARPELRPKLIQLMKHRIRLIDERNLDDGENYDCNWLIRELGLTEILFDPPPPRPRRRRAERASSGRRALLTVDQAEERFRENMHWFKDPDKALKELEERGSTLVVDVFEVADGMLNRGEYALFLPFAVIVYFCLVTEEERVDLNFERMAEAFDQLNDAAMAPGADLEQLTKGSCAEPHLLGLAGAMMFESIRNLPKKERASEDAQVTMLLLLKVLINEITQARLEAG